jgi:hypothetical protein
MERSVLLGGWRGGRRPTRRREEAGLTLVEVSIGAVVVGIVIACVATTLVLVVREGPSVTGRSTFGGAAAFLVNSISDDVANSSAVTPPAHGGLKCSPGAKVDLGEFTLLEGTTVSYAATISDDPVAVVDGTDIYQVDVSRTPGSSTAVLTGYCAEGASLGAGVTYADPTYTLGLSLQASPGKDVRDLSLSAARRTKLASAFNLAGDLYGDANGNATWDKPWESPLRGWEVTVWDSTQTTTIAVLTTDANGQFGTRLAAGSYVVCPTLRSGWMVTGPATDPGVVVCNTGGHGRVVSPADYTSIGLGLLRLLAMGSPSNQFGNDPDAISSFPVGNPPPETYPNFWANIAGGDSSKQKGDAYAASYCDIPTDGCSGIGPQLNLDYDPGGYIYAVHFTNAATVNLQAFDPAFVQVGDTCTDASANLAGAAALTDVPHYPQGANNTSDRARRYRPVTDRTNQSDPGFQYCTGDQTFTRAGVTGSPPSTTFTVLKASIPGDPASAQPAAGCTNIFPAFRGDLASALRSDFRDSQNRFLASYFRQWTNLCTVTGEAGDDFFIQVSTDAEARATTASRSEACCRMAPGRRSTSWATRTWVSTPMSAATNSPSSTSLACRARPPDAHSY